eukprot:tig00021105_g18249.t1
MPSGSNAAGMALAAMPAFYDRPGGFQAHVQGRLPQMGQLAQQQPKFPTHVPGRPPSGNARFPPIGFPTNSRPASASAGRGGLPSAPDPTELLEFARYIGLDPIHEMKYAWVAAEAMTAALPEPWEEYSSEKGIFYYNPRTDQSTYEHPADEKYRRILDTLRDLERDRAVRMRERRATGIRPPAQRAQPAPAWPPVTPEETMAMAEYMGIDLKREPMLAWIAREAAAASLPPDWTEVADPDGSPIFYNTETGEASREHPEDRKFRAALSEERSRILAGLASEGPFPDAWARQRASHGWYDFVDMEGNAYMFNFITNQRSYNAAGRTSEVAAMKIQAAYRARLARLDRDDLRTLHRMAATIQAVVRRRLAARGAALLARLDASAAVVQAAYRRRLARALRGALRENADMAARYAAERMGELTNAATAAYRGRLARRARAAMREARRRREAEARETAARLAAQQAGGSRPGSQGAGAAGSRPSSRPAGLYVDPGTPEWGAARKIQTLYRAALCRRLLARYHAVLEAERHLPGGDIYSATVVQAVFRRYRELSRAGTPQRPRSAASTGSGSRRRENERRRGEQAAIRRDLARAASSLAERAGAAKPGTAAGGARRGGGTPSTTKRGGTPSESVRRLGALSAQMSPAEEFEMAMAEAAALLRRRAQDDVGRAAEVEARRRQLEEAKRELERRRAEAERRRRRAEEGRALLALQEEALRAGDERQFRAALEAMQAGAATVIQAAARRRLADRRADEAAIAALASVGLASLFPALAAARAAAREAGAPGPSALAAMARAVAEQRGAALVQTAYRAHIARRIRRLLAEAAEAARREGQTRGAATAIQAAWRRALVRRFHGRAARWHERIVQNSAARCIQAAVRRRVYRELRAARRAELAAAVEAHQAATAIQACVRARAARLEALASLRYREYEVEARARLLFGEEGEELHRARLEAVWAPHDADTGRFVYDALNQLAEQHGGAKRAPRGGGDRGRRSGGVSGGALPARRGRWNECVDVLEEILRQRLLQFGAAHEEAHRAAETVALAANSFALRYLRLGKYGDALALLRKAALHTERDRMLFPLRAELRAVTMDNLAAYYYHRGAPGPAEAASAGREPSYNNPT